ncbi:MAG TPA: twin-arginine translocation signal domain-containing protein [Anaerolineae bacterium]|nr:twin-arginine translocation signal domain-containing protein [Anaerolineae bacterium]
MEDKSPDKIEETLEVKNPDRRKLLKLLAAGGAVTAVSMLPGKWSSPVVKSGVLPAHAQATPGRYEVECNQQPDLEFSDAGVTFFISATATDIVANQPLNGVTLTATITTLVQPHTDSKPTNAPDGIAQFVIAIPSGELGSATTATVEFDNQALYGTDSCSTPLPPIET